MSYQVNKNNDKIIDLYNNKKPIELNSVIIYPRPGDFKSNTKKSGTYYLWDKVIVNGKIRITTSEDNVQKYGCVTGWVSIDDILKDEDISVGDAVLVNGTITEYADGGGATMYKSNIIMYVIEIISEEFGYNYALASSPNRARQGWAKKEMLEKQ